MAVPRPLLLVLLGTILAAATFFAARNAREVAGNSDASKPVSQEAAQPSQLKLAPQGSVKSGAFRLDMELSGGVEDGVKLQARGRFQSRGRQQVPAFAIDVNGAAGGRKVRAGAVSTGDAGFVTQNGSASRLPAQAWSQITAFRRQALQAASRPGARRQEGLLGIGFDDAVTDWEKAGVEQAGGVPSDRYRGKLEPVKLFDAAKRIAAAQGQALPALPANARTRLQRAVPEVKVEFWVGQRDRVLHRFKAEVKLKVPEEAQARLDVSGKATLSLDYELSQVGKRQTIVAPTGAGSFDSRDPVTSMLASGVLGAGVAAIDVPAGASLAAPGADTTRAPARGRRAPTTPPPGFKRAIAARKKVVIFLYQRRGSDDAAVARAVDGLRGVKVYRDNVDNLSRYGSLVGTLGVSQAPSVVIIGRRREPRLVQGYIDRESLAQEVADTP